MSNLAQIQTAQMDTHTDNGMNFNNLLDSYTPATPEQLEPHEHLRDLAFLLGDEQLLNIDSDITLTDGEGAGEIKPTADSIGAVLKNPHGQRSNLAIYPSDDNKPFLLHNFTNDGFIIGEGSEVIALPDIEEAGELWIRLTDSQKDNFTLITPFEKWQFDSLVKAHSKQKQVTIFTDYKAIEKQRKTFKADNVRLVATVDNLPDMLMNDK